MVNLILAKTPDIIPAVPERSCGIYAIRNIVVGGDEFPKLNASVEVQLIAIDEHGYKWSSGEPVILSFDDLFAEAETNIRVAALILTLNEAVREKLIERGLVEATEES